MIYEGGKLQSASSRFTFVLIHVSLVMLLLMAIKAFGECK